MLGARAIIHLWLFCNSSYLQPICTARTYRENNPRLGWPHSTWTTVHIGPYLEPAGDSLTKIWAWHSNPWLAPVAPGLVGRGQSAHWLTDGTRAIIAPSEPIKLLPKKIEIRHNHTVQMWKFSPLRGLPCPNRTIPRLIACDGAVGLGLHRKGSSTPCCCVELVWMVA